MRFTLTQLVAEPGSSSPWPPALGPHPVRQLPTGDYARLTALHGRWAAYLAAGRAVSASSLALPSPPGSGVLAVGSGGCGWIPSWGAPLWPEVTHGKKQA